jgi:L-ascorbate metabolism protein UlaG (beta-lactamase superfamily)
MLNIAIRRKMRQFGRIIRHSALTPRTGQFHKPLLAARDELGLTFIGHSGFFVQIGGRNLVVDPNFARWLFILKRLRRPGMKLRDLPPMDYVLVTHAHFDHLHRPSLRAIARWTRWRTGKRPTIIVPHNVSDLVRGLGFGRIIEMEWWREFRNNEDGFSVVQTPSQHWGARMLRDYHRGYGGYVIRTGRHSLYHAGDTAYFEGFREIGARLRPQLALLPIGAYHPPSFRNVHTSPEDAVQAFLDLKARWMVPMHYGTFRLSQEPMHEPLERLRYAARSVGVEERVLILEEGKTKILS